MDRGEIEVVAGEHVDDTGQGPGLSDVDAPEDGVGRRRANELEVEQTGQAEVVDIAGPAQ